LIICNYSAEFSLKVGNHKVGNHKVGNRSLNGCVGDSRLNDGKMMTPPAQPSSGLFDK
jgi:hypothetical protein